jgi:hypothetical protein
MRTRATSTGVVFLLLASAAWADDAETLAMAGVRLTTEPVAAAGCTPLGRVHDDSVKDLRRKILRAGGNTGVLSFPPEDLSRIYADVFRCVARGPAIPPDVPPPPPGPPPPPPPGPYR